MINTNLLTNLNNCDFQKITVTKLIRESQYNINPLHSYEFISLEGFLQYEKLENWKEKAAFTTGFYNIDELFKKKNSACGGFYNDFELTYVIDYPKMELKYLGEEIFRLFEPEIGDISELNVFQFEKLLKNYGYNKLKINLESNENYFRLLMLLFKEYNHIIPSYDGFWINVVFDHKGKLWKPIDWAFNQ